MADKNLTTDTTDAPTADDADLLYGVVGGNTRKIARGNLHKNATTLTASAPFTITQTWNSAGVTFEGMLIALTSTASAAASRALNITVGGSTVFNVVKTGDVSLVAGAGVSLPGSATVARTAPGIANWAGQLGIFGTGGQLAATFGAGSFGIGAGGNITPFTINSYSLTAAATAPMLDLNGTWNTSGSPVALKLSITNTASGASAKFISLLAGAGGVTEVFNVDKAGAITIGNTLNSVSPTSPNRTITMVVGGVTVYVAAKTTND